LWSAEAVFDTSERAAALQAEIQERIGGGGRLRLALDLSDLARSLARAGQAARHTERTGVWIPEALHPPLP
jgi:hypothetical protein